MTSLRVLYVDTERVWRGGQEQQLDLMRGIQARGHQVWLAAPPKSPLSQRAKAAGIRVHPFQQSNEISPLAVLRLGLIGRKHRVQILHLNTPRAVLAGGLAARLGGAVSLCARRVNFPLRSSLSSWKYNRLQLTVAVSESIRQTLAKGGVQSDRMTVVYEGVDLARIDSLEPALPVEGAAGLTVGTVAHLTSEKGHRALLEAAVEVVARLPQTHFVLVGSGRLQSEMEESIRELGLRQQVTLTGFRADAEALMKGFDVFCLPSLSEGLSSALMAAMGTGLPVVATQVGGNPELVVDEKTGILVPPNDPGQLTTALCRLLESDDLRKKMGAAGRMRVKENFTLLRKLEQTERLYRELLASRGII